MESHREEAKIGGNRTCDSCQKYPAEMLCACTQARTYLCRGCIGKHLSKDPEILHQLVSADIEVSDLSAYRQRNDTFAAGSAELQQNLVRIDQCCQEVVVTFNEMIEHLKEVRDDYVRSLQAWKVTLAEEIAEAENEVKRSLAQDSVHLKGKYSAQLRNFQPGTLQLFTYKIDTSGFQDVVQHAVKLSGISESFRPRLRQEKDEADRLAQLAKSEINDGNYPEAIELCAQASKVYSRFFPNDISTARNLRNWGDALMNMGKNAEAVTKYAPADTIYSQFFPNDIHTANNLKNWGVALRKMGKNEEAVTKYAAADAIYSRLFPTDINTARNLYNWGFALRKIGKNAEAVVMHAAADTIYSRLFPSDINTAHNLGNWGLALRNMGKNADAVRKFEAAKAIFISSGATNDVRACESEIARLR